MIQVSWGVIPTALPYAAANTTLDEGYGESFLQWAIAMGYLTEFLGSASSYIPTVTGNYWIKESLAVNTLANGIIVLSAFGIGLWSSWGMRFLLMSGVAVSRFTFGWTMPLILRELSRKYPGKKELLVRSNSLWVLYGNIVFRIPVWMLSSGVIPSNLY